MDIFVINTDDYKNVSKELLEKYRHKEFKDLFKQNQHSLSYLMLDRILKEVYKISEYEIIFVNKKPCLKNNEKYFSISHSDEYIAICFSNHNCGIDIEKIKERDFKKISARKNFKSENIEDFYKNWTKFEAEYKLAETVKKCESVKLDDYMITAVSASSEENFEIFIQSSETFPNLLN